MGLKYKEIKKMSTRRASNLLEKNGWKWKKLPMHEWETPNGRIF